MVPREEIARHIRKVLIYMDTAIGRRTELIGKPSTTAVAFERTVKFSDLWRSFVALPPDAVLPHSAAQRARVDTKDFRCAGAALDTPAGFLQRVEDMIALHLTESPHRRRDLFLNPFDLLFAGGSGRLEPVQYPQR